jgi:Glycosyltransferase (GlcNAc)
MNNDLIFVSVASYCDPLLGFTLDSALSQAHAPERLRFGVVDQSSADSPWTPPEQARPQQVRRVHLSPLDARGPCFARALAMGLYQGEAWFLQVDSHTCFEPGWDERLLHWARHCGAHNPRSILSCYPNPFSIVDGQPVPAVVTREVLAHVVRTDCDFATDHPVLMFEGVPVSTSQPVPAFHVAAGCLFAPGRLVNELPCDPFLYFHGEEQSMALRAWTQGWDLFHVPDMPLLHQYVQTQAAPRPLHWQADVDEQRAVRSADLDRAAHARLRALLWDGADLGVYGLGRQRSLQDYAAFSGIDYAARRIEPRARKARFGY